MAEPFLAEIRMMSFNFPPKGWALCNGQVLPINQNQALFSLLGTTFGGDGRVNFALPDMRARTAMHAGGGSVVGQRGGEQAHSLNVGEMPLHTHPFNVNNGAGNAAVPTNAALAKAPANLYAAPTQLTGSHPSVVSSTGGSQAHENMQPYLTIGFCIALQGIFPSRN